MAHQPPISGVHNEGLFRQTLARNFGAPFATTIKVTCLMSLAAWVQLVSGAANDGQAALVMTQGWRRYLEEHGHIAALHRQVQKASGLAPWMSETGHIDIDLLREACRKSELPRGVGPVMQALLADCLEPGLWATTKGIGLMVVFSSAGISFHDASPVMEFDAAGGLFGLFVDSPYLVVVECKSGLASLVKAAVQLEDRALLGQMTFRMVLCLPADVAIPVIGCIYVPHHLRLKGEEQVQKMTKPRHLLKLEVYSY